MTRHRATLLMLLLSFTVLSFSFQAWGQTPPTLELLDESGAATSTYVEGSRVFVRVVDVYADVSPGEDSVQVRLAASRSGDVEFLTLTETAGGVFRGSIPLAPGPASQPGVLETAADPNPPHDRDTIEASYNAGQATATASMAGSLTWFLDGDGRVRQSFAVGESVHVRVADSLRNDPATLTSFQITVTVPATGEQEVIYVQETGFDTGIFEGSIATVNGFTPSGDGVLGTAPGQAIEAVHPDADLPTSSRADATMVTSRVDLVDAQGRPAEYYLESNRVYVQVLDIVSGSPGVPDTVQVTLQADISGDQEFLTLQETGFSTGIYEGSMELRRGPGLLGNGTLETHIDGPPYRFDTVRATSGTSTDAVGMIGSLTAFVDAYGNEVASYPAGVTVHVRVEDHNFNDPSRFDTVGVTVTSLGTGDAEGLTLLEVAKDSGIFEGSLATQIHAPVAPNDGYFPVQPGHEIEAMHVDINGVLASGDRARIESASIAFVDEAGRPTAELLENGTARIRVISFDSNGNPGQADGLLVQLRALRTGDQETVPLAETGPDTSIFEGTVQLSFNLTATLGNGLLETSNPPPYAGDEVTASYGPFSATARTVGAWVVFVDGFGRETTTFPVGSRVRVRVTDPSRNTPTDRDTAFISLSTCQGDQESFQLTETGFNTAVFEGEIPSGDQTVANYDGTLQGVPSCAIEAFYQGPNYASPMGAVAAFTGGEVLFVNAQGQPASVFLEGTRAYLRVVDPGRSGSVPVEVTAELSGDREQMTLSEAAPGVFTGSIELRSGSPGLLQNGILETAQAAGPPHEFETLRAVYQDPSGDATATASTLNFRVWFIDAYGAVTTTYARGSRVYVRMENHNYNDPARFDRLGVTVRTSRGDEEPLQLLETGKATGIYEGSLELDGANPPSFGDGRLQAGPGDELDARFDPEFNASPAKARVELVGISFIDEAGVPTMELLENGRARVRVISPDHNTNPDQADGLLVQLRALYTGDQEDLPLAETGPDTGVFESSIQLSFNLSSVSQGNGVLETGNQGPPEFLSDEVTVSFGPFTATARTIGARVVFIDGFGRETTTFPVGSRVRVRVTDPSRNTPTIRNDAFINLTACQNDQESFQLQETGFNTGVFEGEILSGSQVVTLNDGILQGVESCLIRASYYNPNAPTTTETTATFTGGAVLFVDAQGSPASVFLEGTRAYLRVVDHGRSGSVPVEVTAELSGDREQMTLSEATPGVFEGSIELRSGSPGFLQNGILETAQASGPPHEFETLRAVYDDPSGASTATASTLNFRMWFIDAYGAVTTTYAQGSRVYVRMENHNYNDPARFDRLGVTVRTSRGDEEPLQLLETGKTTGIYEGFVDLDGVNPPSSIDGRLQAAPGDELDARFDPEFNASPAKARVEFAAISFIDEAGVPTVELLENGTARVRVISPDHNTSPGQADGMVIQLRSFYLGDQEDLPLAETGPDTGVFEGSIRLSFNFSASQGNGLLETSNSQSPEYLGEQVTASFGPFSTTAWTIGARVVFIDGFGRETMTFPVGSRVRVRVTDPSRNTPTIRNDAFISLTACQNDQESFQLQETGFNTGVFEGEILSGSQVVTLNDGILQGTESCLIQASYYLPNSPNLAGATATFTGGAVLFVDAQGSPASVFLEGTRAYLRVVDPGRSGTVPVEVTAELSGDREQMTLSEATPGVFEGSIELRSGSPGFLLNGILETAQASGPPHEFETLRAVYDDPSGASTATASTLNFRVWFIDAYGAVTTTYAQGSRVYVRLENHNFNDLARFDRLGVTVRTSRGDEEPLYLLETGKTTGIYEGFVDLDGVNPPSFDDGRLQAGPGDELDARFEPEFNASPAKALVEFAAISFIDEAGVPTVELLENGTARVRVISPDHNSNPGQADGMLVQLRSFYAGDQEDLPLAETGPDTGVFEGSIRLSFLPASPGNGVLETGNSQSPEYLGDQVTASFGPFSATARTIGARVVFMDGFGRETTTFPVGSRVRLRVTDPSRNSPTVRNDAFINLTACQNDQESIQLQETGFNTGVFEGEILSGSQVVTLNDGVLQGVESCLIRASYYNPNAPTTTETTATFTGGAVLFVDAQGSPASVFLEGTRAYLRVVDHGRSGSVPVEVTAELSGDREQMTLTEAAPGVFEGSIELRSGSPGTLQNGILETAQAAGPPHEFETLRALYLDPSGSATATASTLNFRVWFIDAYGAVTTTYAQGSRVYVRLENHNFNDPARFDRLGVTVRTSRGDEEPLQLLETGKATGIYEGSIDLDGVNPPSFGDGRLQAAPGDELDARFDPEFNASPAKARIEFAAISFIDEAGVPTVELLENGTARVRVISPDHNSNPGQADGMLVQLRSFYAGDQEDLPLAETGPDTGVFEGSIRLSSFPLSTPGNGLLETFNSQSPEYLSDQVTASFGPFSATARTLGARVVFIDGFGRETTTFPVGSRVRLRVTDPSRNTPTIRNDAFINLTACQNDQESIQLLETGFNTGVFEGEILSGSQAVTLNDGTLQGTESCLIRASYYNPNAPTTTEATATFTGGAVLFVDAQGNPASVFLEGTRAYLRVVDHGRSGTVPVEVTAELSGDREQMTLSEAAPGVFEGSIELRSASPGTLQNGILETAQAAGPPHEFETLRALYEDPSGSSTATASTLNFRVWFIDAYGSVTTTYAQGSRVYVRLENHNYNDPARFDLLGVRVLSSRGDEEPLYLHETGKTTGIYEGSIELDGINPPSFDDGRLQAGPGDELEARFDPEFNASPARARVEFAAISFIDEAGVPTVELLESGTARVRVTSRDHNTNPSQAEGLLVQLRSFYSGDQEDLPLAETGPDTGVFEGSIRLSFYPSASPGNGLLETFTSQSPEYLGEQVTASFGPFSATARTIGARVVFIDGFGRETTAFPLGSRVRVRVTDPSRNTPTTRNDTSISLTACQNDQEFIQLLETGFNTGVFEGEILSGSQAVTLNDGTLQGTESCLIQAFYYNPNTPTMTEATATFTGGAVLFVDAQGNPASVFLEGTRAYLRVVDHGQSGTVPVEVTAELSGDREQVTLSEAAPGVFEGSIELRSDLLGTLQNGTLETAQAGGPPHEFETLRALYLDPSGSSTATASTLNFRVWFVDAYGAVTATYAQGSRVYVRLENHNFNDPERFDQLGVTVRTSRGDEEPLQLLETGKTTGIYEGSIDLDGVNPPSFGDGRLQAAPGDELDARFDPEFNASPAKARVEFAAISFIDEAGVPTMELLENGTARVRVISPNNNSNPGQAEGLSVQLRTFHAGDLEELFLAETGPDTGVFEGSIALSFNLAASQGNGVLETGNQGPEFLGEQVTASFGPFSATARTVGSRVAFLNLRGQPVTSYSLGATVRVRIEDPSRNQSPAVDSFGIQVRSLANGDEEVVTMTETSPTSGIFEGSVPSAASPGSPGDGVLSAGAGDVVEVANPNANHPTVTTARASFLANYAPQAVDDVAETVEDEAVIVSVLANDTDPEADPLTVESATQGAKGAVTVHPEGTVTYMPNAGETGQDTFTYLVTDTQGGEAGATVTVTINPSNRPPVANDDTASVDEDGSVDVAVLANDTDPDNNVLTVASVTQGTNGVVSINPDQTVKYTPSANYNGTDSFTYTISDGNGESDTATVTVTINHVNDAPVANADAASVAEDGTVDVAVLTNDTDPENNTLTVASVTQGTNGAVSINPDQTVKYTPSANYNGADSFTYTASDGNGGTATATVTVTVTAANDAPVANADTATVAEDGMVDVAVLSNDTDADNDTLTVTSVTQGTNGAVSINPDQTVKYAPGANYNGTDSFTYTVSDVNGGTATATVSVTINAVNDAPVANADVASTDEDNPVTVAVLANDTDTEGNTLTVTGTNHQGAVVNADNTVTFAAGPNNFGTYTFTYTVSDGQGGTAMGTVAVTVNEINDPPVAVADAATADEDELAIITVLANDSDVENNALTVTSITQPANGTATLRPNGTVEYRSNTNYNGLDSFTYTVTDSRGATATATVSVTVRPRNDVPVANPDTASVAEDGSVDIPVLANDTDLDGDTLRVFSTVPGAHGTVSSQPDGTIRYTPEANFHGTDSFTYRATDDRGGTTPATTVTVTVTAVNDTPAANADTATVAEDGTVNVAVLSNDTDLDNDTLTVTAVTQGTNGAVSINPDKTVKYTPSANYSGSDSFTYTVSDGNGGTATATVAVTVTAVNDAPVANADAASVAEDGTVDVTVLSNDTDPENDTLTVTAVTQGTNGAVSINPDKTVRYAPSANYSGSDSFTYTVSDGNGGTATATVTVTITAVNDAPVANADAASVAEDGTVDVAVLSNDTDPENDTLTVTSVTQGTNGAVSINPDKTVQYVPAANYNGPDSFTYTVSDGNGGASTATVTITVASGNDAPTANADAASVAEDGAVNVAVLANDSDPENDTLTVTSVTQGANGSVSINPDKTVRYAPAANYSGSDSFTYTVSDGNGGTATAAVTVAIAPVNDAPVAVNDTASVVAGSAVTVSVLANDADVDGPGLSVTAVSQGANGSVAINPDQTVTYTAGLFVGTDSFTYTVSDGAGGTATATVTVTVAAPPRVSTDLQVRYDFNEGSGSTVNDTSGVGTPLHLTISTPSAVSWLTGALSVNADTIISSASAATKVINAARSSNSITVEAWVAADNLAQSGPARIVSINKNPAQTNVVLGQAGNQYETQLRTSSGTSTLQSPVNSASLNLTHVVYTWSSTGQAVTYVDGIQVSSQTTSGSLSNWDTSFRLALANAIGGGKPWLGDLHLVAIYSRDLTSTEVTQNFLAGSNAD